jgi:hypothetical protein
MSANIHRKDILRPDAQLEELDTVGFLQIQKEFSPAARQRTKEDIGEPSIGKPPAHIFPDLITVFSDTGTERGEHLLRIGAIMLLHAQDDLLHDSIERSLPAAVHGSDSASGFIDEENGQAIRCFDDQENPGKICDQGIAAQIFIRDVPDKMDNLRVDLIEPDKPEVLPILSSRKILLFPVGVPESMAKKGNAFKPWDGQEFFRKHSLSLSRKIPFLSRRRKHLHFCNKFGYK